MNALNANVFIDTYWFQHIYYTHKKIEIVFYNDVYCIINKMTKTKRTNQYPRMEFKTKRALRSFKTIFDMFTSGKLSENIDNNNLSRSESVSFHMNIYF